MTSTSVPAAALTAASALYDLGLGLTAPWAPRGQGLYRGQTLVILGASSTVGSYALQLAVLSGFTVITTSSPQHSGYLRSLGASAVIDPSSPIVVSEIMAAAGGHVVHAIDASAHPASQKHGVEILYNGGKLVLVVGAEQETVLLAREKGVEVLGATSAPHVSAEFKLVIGGYLELASSLIGGLSGGSKAREGIYDLHKLAMRPHTTVRAN